MTGTLEHLDPAAVLVGENVRDTADLDPRFIASIREHGVLQPLTAIRTDAGIEVRDGQRRTLAAREAGLASIPVYVIDTDTTNSKAATAETHRPPNRHQRPARRTDRRPTRQRHQPDAAGRRLPGQARQDSPAQVCALHRRAAVSVGGSANPRRRQLLIDLLVSRTELRHTEVGGDMAPAGGRVQRRRPLDRGR